MMHIFKGITFYIASFLGLTVNGSLVHNISKEHQVLFILSKHLFLLGKTSNNASKMVCNTVADIADNSSKAVKTKLLHAITTECQIVLFFKRVKVTSGLNKWHQWSLQQINRISFCTEHMSTDILRPTNPFN